MSILNSYLKGHGVVYAPPCYSCLQHIELLWVLIKSNITSQYDKDACLKVVYWKLSTEFDFLKSDEGKNLIKRIMNKTEPVVQRFWSEKDEEGDLLESESEDGSSDNEY